MFCFPLAFALVANPASEYQNIMATFVTSEFGSKKPSQFVRQNRMAIQHDNNFSELN